jgi:putative acetyltransferase
MTATIREIQPEDNAAIARIIRQVLTEFGANRPGFAWADPELEALTQAYQAERSVYYVAVVDAQVVGGVGIAPLPL